MGHSGLKKKNCGLDHKNIDKNYLKISDSDLKQKNSVLIKKCDVNVTKNKNKNPIKSKMQPDIVNCTIQTEKVDNQELKEFEILENMCKHDTLIHLAANELKSVHINESDAIHLRTSFDGVDFVNTESSDANFQNLPSEMFTNDLVPSISENVESFEEQRFLEAILEECSGDFENFETPPTSIDSTIPNIPTLEKDTNLSAKISTLSDCLINKNTDNFTVLQSIENINTKNTESDASGINMASLNEKTACIDCSQKHLKTEQECSDIKNPESLSMPKEELESLNLVFIQDHSKQENMQKSINTLNSLEPARSRAESFNDKNKQTNPLDNFGLDDLDTASFQATVTEHLLSESSTYTENYKNLISTSKTENLQSSNDVSNKALKSDTSKNTSAQRSRPALQNNKENLFASSTLSKIEPLQSSRNVTNELLSSDSSKSPFKEPPCSVQCQQSLYSASRMSLESADVGRPSIHASAATSNSVCANYSTCSREIVADDSRVVSLRKEPQTPANTQDILDNNSKPNCFTQNTSESGNCSETSDFKCALTSDVPGKTDDRGGALCWEFKNGRLVFGESKSDTKQVVDPSNDQRLDETNNVEKLVDLNLNNKKHNLRLSHTLNASFEKNRNADKVILSSKNLNKLNEESRLKLLGNILKNAERKEENFELEPKITEGPPEQSNLKHKTDLETQKGKFVTYLEHNKNLETQKTDATQAKEISNDEICAQENICHISKFLDVEKCVLTKDCTENNVKTANFFDSHKYSIRNVTKNAKNSLKNEITREESNKLKFIDYDEFQKSCVEEKEKPGVDANQNELKNNKTVINTDQEEDFIPNYSFLPENSQQFSEFNAHEVSSFPHNVNNVYREFLEDSSTDCSSQCSCCSNDEPQEHYIVISRKNTGRMRGDGTNMSDTDTKVHNPDKNNLKSLLKRSGGRKKEKNHKNRVVFNENKNEFFDADYIILIREECDFDDEEDDGVCTCNQHEMVRLTCCEPNCNCQYDGYDQTPPSPKFAPPIEFVDAVTLSPPEGYKDMELEAEQILALQQQMARRTGGGQRAVVCRECSASHEEQCEEEGECSLSEEGETDACQTLSNREEKEKTDQSQQTTPTTPPRSDSPNDQRNALNSAMTSQPLHSDENRTSSVMRQPSNGGSPISGILKGGRLWKQSSSTEAECGAKVGTGVPNNMPSSEQMISDDETSSKRSVRFLESAEPLQERRDVCDGAPQPALDEERDPTKHILEEPNKPEPLTNVSPEATEMTLTFKLGNHVLVSNNSLKPNSAVRQLFPNTKTMPGGGEAEETTSQQYLVTAESLRAFEDSKRAKLPQIAPTAEPTGQEEPFKRAIERNTLRRSLIRYEPRSKKQPYKSDNSLVERIKQLTCNVEDGPAEIESDQQTDTSSTDHGEDVLDSRSSPPGEEARNSPDVNTLAAKSQMPEKSFSPSSSSTISSSSSSISSNYAHIQRNDNMPDIQNNFRRETKPLPDIGGPHHPDPHTHPHYMPHAHHAHHQPINHAHCAIANKMSSSSNTSESRRQFLSTLAPLTACVMGTTGAGTGHGEDYYYSLSSQQPGGRTSVASSTCTEYSLEDIDEGLKNQDEEDHRKIAPDVLAGTPSASESGDELAMFVQQDMNRIERIKKKYQPEKDEDDEHDDYGFNRRPSVRGIKPRFGTTTEILQQIQNQLQPPPPPQTKTPAWPYYSESNLSDTAGRQKTVNPQPQYYSNLPAEESAAAKTRAFAPSQYRASTIPTDQEGLYQNCTNQRCGSRQDAVYSRNVNIYQSTVVRVGNDYYQSLPRQRNGRPQSPPPMELAKSYHQTMVYIPYNHIEAGYQPVRYNYHPAVNASDYVSRISSQNQINNSRRYVEPIYPKPQEFNQNTIPPLPPKLRGAQPYPGGQPPSHLMAGSRSESPLPGQFSTARSTQTGHPSVQQCAGYYPTNPRYRPMINPVWPGDGTYSNKMNRHSYPARLQDSSSLSTDSDSTSHSGSIPNGYNRASVDMSNYATIHPMSSPTKSRFIERGVPEGAASVSPQDLASGGGNQTSSGTMTSPTSPQNPPTMPQPGQKLMFYAMNV